MLNSAKATTPTTVVDRSVNTISVKYPYAVFNETPAIGEKLSLKWILGIHPNGCTPAFKTSISKTMMKSNPPIIQFKLDYALIPDEQKEIMCAQVLTPYGPVFELGVAESGKYEVYIADKLVKSFFVATDTTVNLMYPYSVVTPLQPYSGDDISVQWVLGEDSVNCVMQYEGHIVSRSTIDTFPAHHNIYVDYKETPVNYVWCGPERTLFGPTFKIATAEPGNYSIHYNKEIIAHFTVKSRDPLPAQEPVSSKPEQPFEGDTLQLRQILGYGSGSCAPKYESFYELISENNNQFIYKLSYKTIPHVTFEVCTKDYIPHGPVWEIPSVKAGYYLFELENGNYYKLLVQKKLIKPVFSYATIKGTVYNSDPKKNYGPAIIYDTTSKTVQQCTVAVISYQISTSDNYDKSVSGNSTNDSMITTVSEIKISRYIAITDKFGNYTISNIPVSILMGNAYIVSVHGDLIGYQSIPNPLQEQMTANIQLYHRNTVADSAGIPTCDDVLSLFKDMNEQNTSVNSIGSVKSKIPTFRVSGMGFEFVNPSMQKVTFTAFSVSGRKIWSMSSGKLSAGSHVFKIPNMTTGIVLIKAQGETFKTSEVLNITR
jgi:hypothetical protein